MSRAYRIQVSETLRRVIRAEDGVSTHLEILNLLPPEEMSSLLTGELLRHGFEEAGDKLIREQEGIIVLIDPLEGLVTVQASECEEIEVKGERIGWSGDEEGKHAQRTRQVLKEHLKDRLDREVAQQQDELQDELTDRLEAQLGDLRKELDQVANKVTGEALKRKAAQMGQVKEISEDSASGSMTIVLEV